MAAQGGCRRGWRSWPRRGTSLCGKEVLSSQGSLVEMFSMVIRSSVRTSPWIRETRVVEAKGPEVEGTPFKLFSGENMLSECMCVRVREYMLSK